jgi:hypothetical protein
VTDDERAAHDPHTTAHEAAGATIEAEADSTPALDVAAVLAAVRADSRDPVTGRYLPGGMPRLQHGRRAPRLWTAAPLAEALAEREAAIVGHLGGDSNVSAVERPLVRELARLDLLVEAAGSRLLRDGLETRKHRSRTQDAALYATFFDRHVRLSDALGFRPRARPAASLATWAASTTGEVKS